MKEKMRRTSRAAPGKAAIDIRPGPVSPAQKRAWDRFWRRLITEAQQGSEHGRP